jgi:hypothetical protein
MSKQDGQTNCGSSPLLSDDCSGEMVSIYKHELYLLQKIAERTSDYFFGLRIPEFAEHCGGVDKLQQDLHEASKAHADWLSGFDS